MSKVFDQMEGENQPPTRFSMKQDDTEMDFENYIKRGGIK